MQKYDAIVLRPKTICAHTSWKTFDCKNDGSKYLSEVF